MSSVSVMFGSDTGGSMVPHKFSKIR